jgi:hypothetical protein
MGEESRWNKLSELLRDINGYFVWHNQGEELVIMRKEEFDRIAGTLKERQLALLEAAPVEKEKPSADEMLDKINRDLALYQLSLDSGELIGQWEEEKKEQ